MRLPVAADGRLLHPISLELFWRHSPLSSADMVLTAEEAQPLTVGSCITLTPPGGTPEPYCIVRTTMLPAEGTTRLQLRHSLCLLADSMVLGRNIYPAGTSLQTLLNSLLGFQHTSRWAARVDASLRTAADLTFSDENLLSALLRVPDSLEGIWRWRFDHSTTPWTLILEPESQASPCELRPCRNLLSARVSLDRDPLATQLLPLGKDGMDISSVNGGVRTLTADTAATHGIITRIYRDNTAANPAALLLSARKALQRCSQPARQITAQAYAPQAGDPTDIFLPGKPCHLVLPEAYAEAITAPICCIHWPDLVQREQEVELTISQDSPSVTDLLPGTGKLE